MLFTIIYTVLMIGLPCDLSAFLRTRLNCKEHLTITQLMIIDSRDISTKYLTKIVGLDAVNANQTEPSDLIEE